MIFLYSSKFCAFHPSFLPLSSLFFFFSVSLCLCLSLSLSLSLFAAASPQRPPPYLYFQPSQLLTRARTNTSVSLKPTISLNE